MNIDRRQLALPVLAIGLLGVVPAFAAADEEVVAKNVEAFRAAQAAANAEILAALCAAELSYSHSDGRVEDKATFIANATNGKSKIPVAGLRGRQDSRRRRCRDRAVPLGGRKRGRRRRQEELDQSSHPDELAKAGRGLETAVAGVDQALIAQDGQSSGGASHRPMLTRALRSALTLHRLIREPFELERRTDETPERMLPHGGVGWPGIIAARRHFHVLHHRPCVPKGCALLGCAQQRTLVKPFCQVEDYLYRLVKMLSGGG